MRRKWLIDAHNLMYRLPHAAEAYSRNRLEGITVVLQCVAQMCHKYDREAMLVFDGHPLRITDKPDICHVEFSGNKPADLIIRNILRKNTSNNRWTVVSDDHEVKTYARRAGCDIEPVSVISEDFTDKPQSGQPSQEKAPGEEAKVNMSEEELKEWKLIFGID